MNFYKRDVFRRLFFLRSLLIIFLGLIAYLVVMESDDYVIILSLIVLIWACFPTISVSINADSFRIRKYYLFGYLTRTWSFSKGESIKVYSDEFELESDRDADVGDSGFLLGLLLIFTPRPKLKFLNSSIEYTNKQGRNRKLQARLTTKEYELIARLFKGSEAQQPG